MAEFKIIETQEDFDRAIQKRLEQKEREVEGRYKDYLAPDAVKKIREEYDGKLATAQADLQKLTDKQAAHDKELADLTARAIKAETDLTKGKAASKHGIPLELAGRLVGDTPEAIEKDAESFAALMGSTRAAVPLRTNDPGGRAGTNSTDAALAAMLQSLTGSST